MSTMRFSSCACLLVMVAACSPTTPQPAPSMPYAAPGVQFTVDALPGDCSRASVAWEVPEDTASKIEIQIDSEARKVFARSSDQKGHQDTGPWVKPGLAFYLVDRGSGKVLAATQVPADYCAPALAR
jgi:hypothetical protein